jgi:hypothetical protein
MKVDVAQNARMVVVSSKEKGAASWRRPRTGTWAR